MSVEFTPEQKSIFDFVKNKSGHGIIDAVAGAGKTTTIIECARYVCNQNSILFCAFNTSISKEIERKFRSRGIDQVAVKTIHALGRQILHENNNTGHPITLEENKYRELLKSPEIKERIESYVTNIININGLTINSFGENNFAVNNLLNKINSKLLDINQKFRSTLTEEDILKFEDLIIHYGIFNEIEISKLNFREELSNYFEITKILLEEGNNLSKRSMIIDYTDMLYLPFKWKLMPVNKFEFLFIDECQDLSRSQFAVATKYGKSDGRVLAVGDPRQSIYGFTGADIESFNNVKIYTKAVQLPLTTCFRCPTKVIEIAKTIRPDIVGNKSNEGNVSSISFEEVITIARPGDLIISRLRAPLLLLVFNFIDKNIKVRIHIDEVNEIISELKGIFKANELNTIITSLSDQFIGLKITVANRWKWIIEKNAERIIDSTERKLHITNENLFLKKKLDFLEKKYEQWKEECPTLLEILKKIKDFITAADNAINLSTIHRAKGLENERVFILNYDELPYFRLQQKEWEKIQEINLKYVAVTRSLNELYLIKSKSQAIIENEQSLFDNLPFF